MPAELRSLDFRFIVRELRASILGGKFRKVYQYGQGQNKFLFDVYVSTKGGFWLYSDTEKMFLAQRKMDAPETPPNFCMFLRKHLMGATVKDIRQHGFDRVIEIVTDRNILVFEFVPPGNVILCDTFYNVIMPLRIQRWKDRETIPRKPYVHPPSGENPYNISLDTFFRLIDKGEEKAVAVIARMGFGGTYASEICALARVDPQKPSGSLSRGEAAEVFEVIRNIGERKPEPVTYGDGSVFPFALSTRSDPVKAKWSSFSAPLDEMFSEEIEEKAREPEVKAEKEKQKIERIMERQKAASEKLSEKRADEREKGDMIYKFYGLAEGIIDGISNAKASGLSWEEIKQRVKGEPTPEAEAIVEIREHDGTVVADLGGMEVELDFTKSVEENAARYYDGSKDARRKYEGAQAAIEQKMMEYESAGTAPQAEKSANEKKPRKPRRKWYEKFRWFISSKKFLIVAGRDAATNEELVKKRTEPGDFVFHTDIHGSAFVVIKAKSPKGTKFAGIKDGGEIPLEVKKEASEMAAACSKAWSQGLGTIDVYAVKPDQVSKNPPSGMSLPKGSFMIYGTREWFRDVEVKMAIGVLVDRKSQQCEAIAGPVMALRTYSKYFVTVRPGQVPVAELSKEIKNRLGYKASPEDRPLIEALPNDSIQRIIPSSSGQLVN